jgi:fumarate hydratase class I
METYNYEPTIQLGKDTTEYRKLSTEHVRVETFQGKSMLIIDPKALTELAYAAFNDVSFFLRASHLEMLAKELLDPEASDNDRFVIYTLLQNAVVAKGGQLPSCQDTGTAIVLGKKGQQVWTGGGDEEALSKGIYQTYQEKNLRYSQIAPLTMFDEKNTRTNLPAQIDLLVEDGDTYKFLFIAKGGGSANKSYLYQQTKSLLNEAALTKFITEKLMDLGTAACPPYHIALVIGGTSAETTMKLTKLASCGYLDDLPTNGSEGGRAFRDTEWEKKMGDIAANSKVGAQFGGKYFAHDVRVVRMPRHAASCPVGLGVSCSADRNIKGKFTKEGIFLEQLEYHPEKYLPQAAPDMVPPVSVNLDEGMDKVLEVLNRFPIKTRLNLTGTLIVARDSAHAKIQEVLNSGGEMPDYFKNHPIYYAGPAKTPEGMPSGSFGPTTAGRMDPYVESFQKERGSMVMLAKGNRSQSVTDSCKKHGGFYLGSIGGPAAILAEQNIKEVEVIDFPEMGMEAIRKIRVENFPAFIVVDNKGNDFFKQLD